MTSRNDKLSQVSRFVANWATQQGINLHDHFKTADEFKQWIMALCIKTLADSGCTMQEAFDAVIGDGEYEALADRVWAAKQ